MTDIERAAGIVAAADALLITAGAGMGVDSGLPDFRGQEGFWRAYPAIAQLGISFEEMANPGWFGKEPALAWAFYGHRLNLYRKTEPHLGFKELLEICNSKSQGYFVFTSNVDGQFQKAGFSQQRIVECHGSIHHFQCSQSCAEEIWDAREEVVTIDTETFRALEPMPRCRNCQALARPNILMFADWSWIGYRTGQQQQRFSEWLDLIRESVCKLAILEFGAGAAIPTVRKTSEGVAQQLGAKLIRINPRETFVPGGHIGLSMGAANAIHLLFEQRNARAVSGPKD